jgi:hypothetical protein
MEIGIGSLPGPEVGVAYIYSFLDSLQPDVMAI